MAQDLHSYHEREYLLSEYELGTSTEQSCLSTLLPSTSTSTEYYNSVSRLICCVPTRGHVYNLYPHSNRLDVRHYFFSERVIELLNSIPTKSEHFSIG